MCRSTLKSGKKYGFRIEEKTQQQCTIAESCNHQFLMQDHSEDVYHDKTEPFVSINEYNVG